MATPVLLQQSHDSKVDINVLRAQLSNKQKGMITEDTVAELVKLSENPDYGEEFLDMYRDHLNILSDNPKYTSVGYMSAVKYFSLVEAGNSLTDAYIIVFPERYKARLDRGQGKSNITGEASRYNATALLQEIRKVAGMPVQLIHRHLLHEAILGQAELMRGAESETVRQKAGEVLIRELKPAEDTVLSIKVDDGSTSVIQELQRVSQELAAAQHNSVVAGVPLKDITNAKIQQAPAHSEVIEAEYTEGPEEPFVKVAAPNPTVKMPTAKSEWKL